MDVAGEHQLNVHGTIHKHRVGSDGKRLLSDTAMRLAHDEAVRRRTPPRRLYYRGLDSITFCTTLTHRRPAALPAGPSRRLTASHLPTPQASCWALASRRRCTCRIWMAAAGRTASHVISRVGAHTCAPVPIYTVCEYLR